MIRLPWVHGPLADWRGPRFVGATRFTYRHRRHLPLVFWNGLRLRAAWGENEGAIGLSIMADWRTRTTYTLSAWRSEDDLRRWVRGAAHARLMRAFAARLESMATHGWIEDDFDLRAAWAEGRRHLQ
jgi:heme-degrading monooxygenase HmoA